MTFDEMREGLEEHVLLLTEYRQFFDMSLDMMCIAATDGYFKQVNEAWTRELGWSEEELLSRPFVSFVHPDDVQKTIDEVAKLDKGIPTVQFDNRYLHKDGTYRVLRWASTPKQGAGRVYATAGGQPKESPRGEGGPPGRTSPTSGSLPDSSTSSWAATYSCAGPWHSLAGSTFPRWSLRPRWSGSGRPCQR